MKMGSMRFCLQKRTATAKSVHGRSFTRLDVAQVAGVCLDSHQVVDVVGLGGVMKGQGTLGALNVQGWPTSITSSGLTRLQVFHF